MQYYQAYINKYTKADHRVLSAPTSASLRTSLKLGTAPPVYLAKTETQQNKNGVMTWSRSGQKIVSISIALKPAQVVLTLNWTIPTTAHR